MNNLKHQAPFSLFAFTWAIAGLLHQLSFTDWRWYDVEGILLSATILWVLHKPSSWQRFAVFLLVDWVSVAWTFPLHPNHIVFSWVINGTLLAALVAVARTSDSRASLAARWYEAFVPWLRIELCLLYFFTVFHKLNVSYFDLDWSCAAQMHLEINERIPLLPGGTWAQYASIYGTLIIETAIPVLLIFGRTRAMGIMLGMLFHGLLALHGDIGLFSFSSVMTALFTVFLPANTSAALIPPKFLEKAWPWVLAIFAAILLFWAIRNLLPERLRLDETLPNKWKVGFLFYYAYLGIGLLMFIQTMKAGVKKIQAPNEGNWMTYPAFIVFPFLLVVNGFGPYFGLKTQTSFSMFSNLHTENGFSNHLIVPAGLQLTNWQYDLVEVIDSSDDKLNSSREKGLLIAYLELRRVRTAAISDFWVIFKRNGRIEKFDLDTPSTGNILPPLSFIGQRYFYFRPVEQYPLTVRCKH